MARFRSTRYATRCNLQRENDSRCNAGPLASYTELVHCNRRVNHPLLIGTSRTYLSCIGESSAAGQPAAIHDRRPTTRLTIECTYIRICMRVYTLRFYLCCCSFSRYLLFFFFFFFFNFLSYQLYYVVHTYVDEAIFLLLLKI